LIRERILPASLAILSFPALIVVPADAEIH
jgi:hypothetical protein